MKRVDPVRRQRPRSRPGLLSPRPESRSAKNIRAAKEHVLPTSEIRADQNRGDGNRREKESETLACEMRASARRWESHAQPVICTRSGRQAMTRWTRDGFFRPQKSIGARLGRNVGHQLELVAFGQRNVPRHQRLEPAILHCRLTGVPGEKYLDCEISPSRQSLIERRVVLDWMRDNDREPLF